MGTRGLSYIPVPAPAVYQTWSCRARSLHEVSILGDHKMISRIKKIRLVRGNDEVEIQFDLLFSFHGRSMSKSSSEIDEEGACADGESSRSDLTPPRESKRVKLDNGEDSRKWTTLHKQAADVTVRNCALALTPPQEGSGERGVPGVDVDARGPGGMTALHLASCRGTYGDGSSLDDDKDSDDSGGAMVSDLLSLGANYVSKTDLEETPLHLAARHSRADVAKRLLDYGADANARDRLNRTPLHLAIGADAQGVFQVNNT